MMMTNEPAQEEETFSSLPVFEALKLCNVWAVSSDSTDPYLRRDPATGAAGAASTPAPMVSRPTLLPSDAYCLSEFVFRSTAGEEEGDGGESSPGTSSEVVRADVAWCIEMANMLALCNSRTPTVLTDPETLRKLSAAQLRRRGFHHSVGFYLDLQLYRRMSVHSFTEIDDEALRILAWNASAPQCRQFARYLTTERIGDFLDYVARNGDVELFFDALVRPQVKEGFSHHQSDEEEEDEEEEEEEEERRSGSLVTYHVPLSTPTSPVTTNGKNLSFTAEFHQPSFSSGAASTSTRGNNALFRLTANPLFPSFYKPTSRDVLRWMSTASRNGHSKLLALLIKTFGMPLVPQVREGLLLDATESGAVHLLAWLHSLFPSIPLHVYFDLKSRQGTIASLAAQCGHVKVLDWLKRTDKVSLIIPRRVLSEEAITALLLTNIDALAATTTRFEANSGAITVSSNTLAQAAAVRANQVQVLEWMYRHEVPVHELLFPNGRRLHHFAAEWGAIDSLRWMASHGFDICTADEQGETVESILLRRDRKEQLAEFGTVKKEFLLREDPSSSCESTNTTISRSR